LDGASVDVSNVGSSVLGDDSGVLSGGSVVDWASLALSWGLGDFTTTPCLGVLVLTP